MRSLLDHQADGIDYTLHSHGIDASVVGGNISPRLIQFHIELEPGVRLGAITRLGDELADALGVPFCRITREAQLVRLEIPRPDPASVLLFPLMRSLPDDLPVNSAVLGLNETGVPLLVQLDAPDIAHLLVTGASGCGKTVLTRSMISSLALQNSPEQLKLLLIDPRGRAYRDFNGLPNLVCPVVADVQDALHRLRWVVRHLEKRDELGVQLPLLVVFIDELADLITVGGKEVEQLVSHITQRGADAGIHLVACLQKPAGAAAGIVTKGGFAARLVGRCATPDEARLVTGMPDTGADKLMTRGDFLLYAAGQCSRVQSAYISPEEMRQTVEHVGGVFNGQVSPAVSQAAAQSAASGSGQYASPRQRAAQSAAPGIATSASRAGELRPAQVRPTPLRPVTSQPVGEVQTKAGKAEPPRPLPRQPQPSGRNREQLADERADIEGVTEKFQRYRRQIEERQRGEQVSAAPEPVVDIGSGVTNSRSGSAVPRARQPH